MNDGFGTALVGLVIVTFVAICIVIGHGQRQHERAIYHRCDNHGGVYRIARDGGSVVGVTCLDNLNRTR